MIKTHTFSHLGGKEQEATGQEYILTGTIGVRPSIYMNEKAWKLPIFYQGQQPACGAHAGTWLSMLLDDEEYTPSPRATWIDLKSFDGMNISDGTNMGSIFKSLKGEGVLEEGLMQNDVTLSLTEYASQKALTAPLKSKRKNAIAAYGYAPALTFEGLKDYIYTHGGLIALIRVSERFWTASDRRTSWNEKDILPLAAPDSKFPVVSGHFIVLHSFDEKYIYFANSFSDGWGRKGHGYFDASYLPFINQVGTAVDSLYKVTIPAFTKDLYVGVSDPQVKLWQQYLNSHGFPIARMGNGSPGNETEYFGSLTQKATIGFQKANGINPSAGYVGSITRAWVAQNP